MRRVVLNVEDSRLPAVLEALKAMPGVAEIVPGEEQPGLPDGAAVLRALRGAILKAARPEALERFGGAGVIRDTAFQGNLEWLVPLGRGRVAVIAQAVSGKVPEAAGVTPAALAGLIGGHVETLTPRPGAALEGVVLWPEALAARLGMECSDHTQQEKQEVV